MNRRARTREPDRRRDGAWAQPVTIRLAGPGDEVAIARVAGRDSRPIPPTPRLVAISDGAIAAVLSLRTGDVVADPFRPTASLVELLRCHARGARFSMLEEAGPRTPERERATPERERAAFKPGLAGGRP